MKAAYALFLMSVLMGCEYAYDYSYTITNKSDAAITVNVKFYKDSLYIIQRDSTTKLFITSHGIEGSTGPYFQDVKGDLDVVIVTKNDSLPSKRDYLKNDAWVFSNGDYHTTVTTDEFK